MCDSYGLENKPVNFPPDAWCENGANFSLVFIMLWKKTHAPSGFPESLLWVDDPSGARK